MAIEPTSAALRQLDTPLLIDGGLSTELEAQGHSLDDPLWTARALIERPDAVEAAHAAFVAAGAGVLITASYQVSAQGFVAAGLTSDDADRALVASVEVARAAAITGNPSPLVAASVGPYGAVLADGSEYRGRYGLSVAELIGFHRPRVEVLLRAAPDLLAVETIPDLDEANALGVVLAEVAPVPAWVSFTCRDGGVLPDGNDVASAADAVLRPGGNVIAVGVNCTAPDDVTAALERLRSVTDLPLVAYPNAGQEWDAATNRWCGEVAGLSSAVLRSWFDLGLRILGGCCGYNAAAVRDLADRIPGALDN